MKTFFAALFLLMITVSVCTWLSYPDTASDVPVLYWVTDPNPARVEQVEGFHQWLIDHDYITAQGKPIMELRVDAANAEAEKKVIQSVSGVAGDLMDISAGRQLRLFEDMKVLRPVDAAAARLGFGLETTYPGVGPEISVAEHQYLFPCNVTVGMLWINRGEFERVRLPVPPRRWSIEEFESLGRRYVEAANRGLPRQQHFFLDSFSPETLFRSMGLSRFNETLTAPQYDDPRYARTLQLLRKWTLDDHLLPSASDQEGFATAGGYGGSGPQLFYRGNYAMMRSGRYMLIQFRQFERPIDLAVAEPPNAGFPNTSLFTRAAGVYAGSDHPELAELFLAYLASERYNMQVVRDADALPPNPKYTQIQEFLRPADHPNEWGTHEVFAQTAQTIAIGGVYSPFVLPDIVNRIEGDMMDLVMAEQLTPEQAAAEAQRLVTAEIKRSLQEQPELRERYRRLVEQQQRIDAIKARGEKVPMELIENPFYQRYDAAEH